MNDANGDPAAIDAELEAFLAENADGNSGNDAPENSEDEDQDEGAADAADTKPSVVASLQKKVAALTKGFTAQKKTIDVLMAAEQTEIKPQTNIPVRTNELKHSATHLFGMNNSFLAFEIGRASCRE